MQVRTANTEYTAEEYDPWRAGSNAIGCGKEGHPGNKLVLRGKLLAPAPPPVPAISLCGFVAIFREVLLDAAN